MKLELYKPTSWNDITFNQYKRLLDCMPKEGQINNLEALKIRVEQMSILNPSINKEDLMKMSYIQVSEYFNAISFIDEEPVKEIVDNLYIDSEKYELIDFKNLSLEQWIDAEKYSDIINAHKLIAIFYIDPQKYNDIVLDKVSKYIDEQPAPKAFYLISQFFFIQKALELSIKLYSEKLEKKTRALKKAMVVRNWLEKRRILKPLGGKF